MRCIDAPTMVKDGSGWGAMAGVSAAYLAQDGFTGAPAITVEDPEVATYWNDLSENWYIEEQYIKLYPVCRWAQPAVEGALSVMKEHGVTADQIASVMVETFHEAKRLTAIPVNTEQAQYSLPFSVAAALVKGTVGVLEITEEGLTNAQILKLAELVEISETDEFNAAFPARRFARVCLKLKNGNEHWSGVTEAQGDPENKLSDEVIWEKFKTLTTPVLGENWSAEFLTKAQALSNETSAQPLFDLLSIVKKVRV